MESLADPTRLRLVRLLERHELGVVDLCDILQMPQSTVSRHLKVLADARWTISRRQGTTHLYRTILDELDAPARQLWVLSRGQTDAWPTAKQDEMRLVRRLRERETDSAEFFAGAAAEWDRLRGELYGNAFSTSAMLALLPAEMVVADLGCGTGPIAAMLAPTVRQVIGVDASAAMLKAAKRRMETDGLANVDLRRGDLSALPVDAESCDAALLTLVLAYVDDPAQAVREAARILRPGGRVVVVDLLPHDRDDFRRQLGQRVMGFDPRAIEKMLTDAGLSTPQVRPLPPEPIAKGPALFLATGVNGSVS